jgi:hypothetical protein
VNVSPRVRRAAAVLLVVFLLTTVWAVYYLYGATQAASSSSPERVATYAEYGTNSFAAAVLPSALYNNSTEVFGGNVTLFSPITQWINVSMAFQLVTDRVAELSVTPALEVTLSTSVWSKTLSTSSGSITWASAKEIAATETYDANVTQIVGLAATIDHQVGYTTSGFVLTVRPSFTGEEATAGANATYLAVPVLAFTFSGSIITPSGLSFAASGALTTGGAGPAADPWAASAPYLAVAASVGGVGGSAWVASRRSGEDEAAPPLSHLTEPFQEAIATVRTVPPWDRAVEVRDFGDLAKIADTLGKPILHLEGPAGGAADFLVREGNEVYRYRYPRPRNNEGGVHPPADLGPVRAGPGPSSLAELSTRLERELAHVRRIGGERDPGAAEVASRARVALALLRSGNLAGARAEIDRISRLVDGISVARPDR